MIISGLSIISGISVLLSACSNDVVADGYKILNDTTTTLVNVTEPNSYNLYYKPAVGYVGDPMPYYDQASGTHYVMYLQDWRDGASTYHPIHTLKTTDASSYISYGEAIPCGTIAEQDPALGTGSTIKKDGVYYTFYTGHKDNATASQAKEAILLATSSDFKTWTKDRSFRLDAPEGYSSNDFRDPYVFFDEDANIYKMLVATTQGGTPVIAQFVSLDLAHWTVTEPFFKNIWGRFYECPDVFKMGNYWYMVYSDKDITRQVQYFYASSLSELQTRTDQNFPPNEGKLEGTAFYAGKTSGTASQRYIYGWCFSRSGKTNTGTGDWAGNLVAHKLVQNSDGTLGLTFPDAVTAKFTKTENPAEHARKGNVSGSLSDNYVLDGGSWVRFGRLVASNMISLKVQAPTNNQAVFGISFVDGRDQSTKYSVYIEAKYNALKFDQVTTDSSGNETRTNINYNAFVPAADGLYQITIVNEQSVCVVYINGQYAFTNRIYNMQYNPWSIFCSDGEVSVSNIKWSSY